MLSEIAFVQNAMIMDLEFRTEIVDRNFGPKFWAGILNQNFGPKSIQYTADRTNEIMQPF